MQFAPVTPDQGKRVERNQLSEIAKFHIDERSNQEKYQIPHAAFTSLTENHNPNKGGDYGIDLNKTPRQKPPKRKKHRPKVVREGKPKTTPTPVTPKCSSSKEKPLVKRTYVRRKGLKTSTTDSAVDPSFEPPVKTCRRVLNFNNMHAFKLNSESQSQGMELMESPREDLTVLSGNGNETEHAGPNKNSSRSGCTLVNHNTMADGIDQLVFPAKTVKITVKFILKSGAQSVPKSQNDSNCSTHALVANAKGERGSKRANFHTPGHIERMTKKRSKGCTRVRDLASLTALAEFNHLPHTTPKRAQASADRQWIENSNGPPTCIEALVADNHSKIKTKQRTKKGPSLSVSYFANEVSLREHVNAASDYGQTLAKSRGLRGVIRKYIDPIDEIVQRLNCLDINGRSNKIIQQEQNALVPLGGHGIMIPYKEPYDRTKKRRRRAKVDLDPETNRVWNLLMGKEDSKDVEGTYKDKEKRWEEERTVFHGRADSFIARMHLVQGDRRFSQWKGSVVDSVIGVFLTQNVSDHLSSSAYMSLAAQFPLQSTSNHRACYEEETGISVEEPETCIPDLNDSNKWHEKMSSQPVCNKSSMTHHETENIEQREVVSSIESFGSNIGDVRSEGNSRGKQFVVCERRLEMCHESPENKVPEPTFKEQIYSSGKAFSATNTDTLKANKGKVQRVNKNTFEWDSLRKQAYSDGRKRERNSGTMDSLDWEAVRCANVGEISQAIRERGMNNKLAERIKDFLNRLVKEQGSIDLEWLRDVPPDKAKEYLLSIWGLGLKSVECVRLLTLHHLAFPVDTNVGRIAVRLGWVPLQPLPESLQLHLLEMYPMLQSIQRYLWPRLCKLDQQTLYELHYQMITFGKVFCTKKNPNCNACPMRGECKHFASAFASARLALPGPEEKRIVNSAIPTEAEKRIVNSAIPTEADQHPSVVAKQVPLLLPEAANLHSEAGFEISKSEPIIEMPETPDSEWAEISQSDIEDAFYEDPEEIPTIKLDVEEFKVNLQNYMQESNMELQEGEMSKALVALSSEAASIPTPKLKYISRLRTEHQVYELPDSHPLLQGLDRREPDDPSSYLLAIWTPGETENSIQPPETRCGSQESGKFCREKTCFSCNSIREENSQTVRGTLLIPCRTAMRGRFPLNGTYFQVNEVFADHDSSLNPIDVPRAWIWNLPKRAVYFGTSVTTIFKGLSTEGIQSCFWRGFVCVRGFDQKRRAPRPLIARLHFPAYKLAKTKMTTKDE
ncbi:hypothetical protein HHK36_019953 [Tetracentron sinense]|uniref:HhH-GPD domain-containing protein n=1 Tax=Tetracentron sinense TaxID=13715 RepID=A0A834YT74_TETSI|nr:hypothetical protein HHK36_019953 [Tetracentron sinense]